MINAAMAFREKYWREEVEAYHATVTKAMEEKISKQETVDRGYRRRMEKKALEITQDFHRKQEQLNNNIRMLIQTELHSAGTGPAEWKAMRTNSLVMEVMGAEIVKNPRRLKLLMYMYKDNMFEHVFQKAEEAQLKPTINEQEQKHDTDRKDLPSDDQQ